MRLLSLLSGVLTVIIAVAFSIGRQLSCSAPAAAWC
jgi:hypothetical protein